MNFKRIRKKTQQYVRRESEKVVNDFLDDMASTSLTNRIRFAICLIRKKGYNVRRIEK